DPGIGGEPKEAAHARYKIDDVVLAEGVAKRQHRHGMAHLAEGLHRRRANALGGTVGAHELGKTRLNGRIALPQGIVVSVRDLRRFMGVIESVVMADLARKPLELGLGFRGGELVDSPVGRRNLHARETASAAPRNPDPIVGLPAASRRHSARAPRAAWRARSRPERRSAHAERACPPELAGPARVSGRVWLRASSGSLA